MLVIVFLPYRGIQHDKEEHDNETRCETEL